jgi:drug/metabolite transporter (DMT)-like permease
MSAYWLLFAACGPLLWAISNHIDKYILTHHLKGKGVDSLMLFSTLVALPLLPLFYILGRESITTISPLSAGVLFIVGILSAIAIWFYLYALEEEETSIISPLFQTIPLFGATFAYVLLGETLSPKEMLGCFLIITAAMILTLEFDEEFRITFKTRTLLLMLGSALLFGFYETMFKVASIENDFWAAIFWEHVGLLVVGLALLSVPRYRKDFLHLARDNGTPILSLNVMNEIITIGGKRKHTSR